MNTLPAGTVHDTSYYIKSEKVTSPIPGERELKRERERLISRERGQIGAGRHRDRETHIERQRYSLYYKDLSV